MRRLRRAALIALALVVLTAGYHQWALWSRLAELEPALEEARRKLEPLAPVAESVEQMERWQRELEARSQVARRHRLARDRVSLDRAWLLIAEAQKSVAVESLWLRSGRLEVSGRADSAAVANRLGQRLAELELIQDFDLRRFEPSGDFTLSGALAEPKVSDE